MKIKNQFLLSIIVFIVIIAIFAASVFIAQQQTSQLNSQAALSRDVQKHASNLVYLSSDYFLYHDSLSLSQWQTEYNSLFDSLSKMSVSNSEQQTLLIKIKGDAQRLNDSWTVVASYLESTALNVTVRGIPVFQADWSIMSAQNQALIFDTQQISQALRTQIDQLNLTTIILVFALLVLFGAYFITNYLITYRNTLKSISELQRGMAEIGSGNLDYSLDTGKKDELGEVSNSVNQMAVNLKTVTASKTELERAQGSLRESEQRWVTTLTSIGDAVIATDTLGNITFMNIVAEKLTGCKLAEVVERPLFEVFHIVNEETRQEVESPVEKVLQSGAIVGLANHSILLRKDGSEVPIDDSGSPIKDQNGKVTGVVLVFHDITERKKIEDAQRKQASLIDLSPDALIVKKLDDTITFWSQGAQNLYGWTKEEAIGKKTTLLFKTTYPDRPQRILNELKSTGRWSGEKTHQTKFGDSVIVQSRWLASFNAKGEIVEILETNVDITDRKQMETKLEEYARNLEGLVEERTKALQDSERLAAIGATAGMVGHDIRNPLQAITSDVYLAKSDLSLVSEGEEKDGIQESLDGIEKNVEYINKIVQDLQDYARPIKPIAKETKLKDIIDDILARNDIPQTIKLKVKVQKEADEISSDPDILKRVLSNLMTNAVQAMPKGGNLSINGYLDGKDVVVTVEDTGVGIPEEARNKLFTPLFTTKSKGQGFGLAVVKRMTEALGGTVTFESKEGKGTTFIFRLPKK